MSFSGIYRRPVNLNDRINEKGPHASGVGALYKSMAQSMRALGIAVFWRAVWKGTGPEIFWQGWWKYDD